MSTEDAPLPVAPKLNFPAPRVLLVRAPYYRAVVDGLTLGALRILKEANAPVEQVDVAGALELPQAVRLALNAGFGAFVTLGCVIKGETDHYDHVCREAMSGLMNVALQHGLALGNGLLTVSSLDQAEARSNQDGHNKGAEAAVAALMQSALAQRWSAT